ncbi:MAG: hypothetical protein Q4B09_04055 [Lachnospiraceae bacterium]|nr:hypothetical protein [Lachnospiraceae bacterium]
MKKALRHIVSAIAFLLLLAVLINQLSLFLGEKGSSFAPSDFYKYEDGSFDVVVLGPSTARNAIYPMQLWEEYGITAYNMTTAAQGIAGSYYMAQEVFRHQSPKLLIVDIGMIHQDVSLTDSSFLHYVTDTMPALSPVRWKAILDLNPREFLQYIFPLDLYHTRWKVLTKIASEPVVERYKALGAVVSGQQTAAVAQTEKAIDTSVELSGQSKVYLQKLIELCEKQGTELMLLTVPTVGVGAITQSSIDNRRNAAAAVSRFIKPYGIVHLNDFFYGEELGIDPERDTSDGHHMNALGAAKYTKRIGDYITKRYTLEDHREDSSYSWMNEAKEVYQSYYWKTLLQLSTGMNYWFDYLENAVQEEQYLVLLSVGGTSTSRFSADAARSIMKTGSHQTLKGYGNYSYLAVIDRGEVIYESDVRSKSVSETWKGEAGGISLELESSASADSPVSRIRLNGTDYAASKSGLNVVVYDTKEHKVVDSISLSLSDGTFTLSR